MAYGLEVYSEVNGRLLFSTETAGRGTVLVAKGSVATVSPYTDPLSTSNRVELTAGDILAFNAPVTTTAFITKRTATDWVNYPDTLFVTFNVISGSCPSVNYIILRDAALDTYTSGTYGLTCHDASPYAVGPITFDTRKFRSTTGEIQLDPNEVYTGNFSHGTYLSLEQSLSIYYSAGPLEFSSITYFVRKFGYVFGSNNNSSSTIIYQSPLSATYNITGKGVYACNEFTTFGGPQHPAALAPTFLARPILGTYDPQT